MANEYVFGGSNGVAAQDFGQYNGVMYLAGQAHWVIRITLGRPEQVKVQHSIIQESAQFVDDLGFRGRFITFSGSLRVDTLARLKTIVSSLSGVHSGQTIASGVRSAVNPTLMYPTRLRDGAGEVMTEKAVVYDYAVGEQKPILNSAYTIGVPLVVIFRELG